MVKLSIWIPLSLNIIISLYYIITQRYIFLVVSPFFHCLSLYFTSFCYPNHCQLSKKYNQFRKSPEQCMQCHIQKRMRMKHCKRCKHCIHKYDHHCLLMGLCIGQFNQKYYLGFLWFHLINCSFVTKLLWKQIQNQVILDQNGIQHVSWNYLFLSLFLMFMILNLMIAIHLSVQHSYFMFINRTTYQSYKNEQLWYIKDGDGIAFDKGIIKNSLQVLKSNQKNAIDWQQQYIRIRLQQEQDSLQFME